MTWAEFSSLLSGLGADTPLVRTVMIRLENDKETLENFTSAQHRIRNAWRSKKAKTYSQEEMNDVLRQLQSAFASMSGR